MMRKEAFVVALCALAILCGFAVRGEEKGTNAAAMSDTAKKPLEVITVDDFLCRLDTAVLPVKKAPNSIIRDEEYTRLAKAAPKLIEGKLLQARLKIYDVKMRDDHTATILYSDIETPTYDHLKGRVISTSHASKIDVPLEKSAARKIIPGMVLNVLGKPEYHHYGDIFSQLWDVTEPFLKIYYNVQPGQGAKITFTLTKFSFEAR